MILIIASALFGLQWLGPVGFGLAGAGIGISYRIALVLLTKGTLPAIHGILSSSYAAITYGVAALSITIVGFTGNYFGIERAVICVLVMLSLSCTALLGVALRVSTEPR